MIKRIPPVKIHIASIPKPKTPPTPKLFLKNVLYNREKVRFTPVDQLAYNAWREHYQTNPIFEDAARENTLDAWESRGIPSVFIANVHGLYWHFVGEGQTRINSAIKVQEQTGVQRFIPTWDITPLIYHNMGPTPPDYVQHPSISLQPNTDTNAWNNHPERLIEAMPSRNSENDFCGFS